MNSRAIDQGFEIALQPYPDSGPLTGLFGVAPIETGYYGINWNHTVLLTTNHRPTLARISQLNEAASLTVLALEAGGFAPNAAVALGTVGHGQVEQFLKGVRQYSSGKSGRLLVPATIAHYFKWDNQTQIESWIVRLVPGNVAKLSAFLKQDENQQRYAKNYNPAIVQRLITGLLLWAGQSLIFAIPLIVFGWQALIQGLSALLLSTLFLALCWKILPGRGWLKGLVGGTILAVLFGFVLTLVFRVNVSLALYFVFGLFLSALWMSIVFSGARK